MLGMHGPLEWPLPVSDIRPIDAELISVIFARDLLVKQSVPNTGAFDTETGHPINSIDRQAETIGLIADGELQRRVDVALLLIASHVDVPLRRSAIGEAMDQPRVGVKVEDHRFVRSEDSL